MDDTNTTNAVGHVLTNFEQKAARDQPFQVEVWNMQKNICMHLFTYFLKELGLGLFLLHSRHGISYSICDMFY